MSRPITFTKFPILVINLSQKPNSKTNKSKKEKKKISSMNCRNNRARVKDHIQLLFQYNIQYFLSSFSNSLFFFFFLGPLRSSSFRSFRCIYLIIGKDMFGLRDPNLYMNLFKIYRSQLIPNSIKF